MVWLLVSWVLLMRCVVGVLVGLFVFGLCSIRLLSGWMLAVIWFGGFGIDCCVYVGV